MASPENPMYVINIETGSVSYRSSESDRIPFIYHLIDEETANAILKKTVDAKKVIDAIVGEDMKKCGSWKEYDLARQRAKKLLNVSDRVMVPEPEFPEEEKAGAPTNVFKLSDLAKTDGAFGAQSGESKPSEQKFEQPKVERKAVSQKTLAKINLDI